MSDLLDTAREAWGGHPPDWVEALARVCAASTQARVAKELGRSASLVSQVLRARYPGNLDAVEDLVRGRYMNGTVACPAQGDLATHICRLWRDRSKNFSGHNAEWVRMHRACSRCHRNRKEPRNEKD